MRKTAFILGLISIGSVVAFTSAQSQEKKKQDTRGIPDLVAMLKASPGCLGVEVARTGSGKQLIISWFEDKKAVVKWYYSDDHQKLMKEFFPAESSRRPLEKIKDGTGPIMIIASITFAEKPQFKETSLPVSQLALELYQPLDAGGFLGAPFAPRGVKIPALGDYTPKKE